MSVSCTLGQATLMVLLIGMTPRSDMSGSLYRHALNAT
jgi:hypothetical protein